MVNFVGAAIIHGYGRENELEADRLGAEYAARIGYNPEKMLDVLGVLKDQEEFEKQLAKEQNRKPNIYHGVFATHPKNDDRLKEIIAAVKRLDGVARAPDDPEAFLKRLEGLVFGPSEKEGVVKGSRFYHRELGVTFKFPDEWLIDNRPDRVLGSTTTDTSYVVLTVEDRNRKESPRDFLARKFREKDLRGERLRDSQLDGYTALAKIKTPYGTREGRVAAVFHGKNVYIFRAASRTEEEFQITDALFLETMNSLRPLRDDEHELARPLEITLVRVKSGDTFASLAAQSGFSHHAEEQLRLLNGLYPDGALKPGQLIKTVR